MREDSTPRADAHRSEPYYVFVALEGWTNQTDRQTDKQTDRQTDKQYFPNLLGYSESSSTVLALYILFSGWPALPCHMYHNCFKCVCVWVCRRCGQRVGTSTNITQAKRGFYGHGWHFSATNRSDLLEVDNVTYFFSYTLEASVPWRTTPCAGIHSNFFEKSNESVDYSSCQKAA